MTRRRSREVNTLLPNLSASKHPCILGPIWIWSLQSEGVEGPPVFPSLQGCGQSRDWAPTSLAAARWAPARIRTGLGHLVSTPLAEKQRGPCQACFHLTPVQRQQGRASARLWGMLYSSSDVPPCICHSLSHSPDAFASTPLESGLAISLDSYPQWEYMRVFMYRVFMYRVFTYRVFMYKALYMFKISGL